MSVAGPSRPIARANKSLKANKKNAGVHSRKLKKVSEKQQIQDLEQYAQSFVSNDDLKLFFDLPISDYTKRGLKKAFFLDMTDIQAKSLPVSLKGKDVLGAARTGSGKTLAFLIPVLEMLYRKRWGPQDGLGALIISPTRELAVQIFEVLKSIGPYHSFSAGLVIGGKNLKDERDRLTRMNILVATPGRLLQHMDQTAGFDCDNMQILVLDEADRILDMGFSRTLTALISHLPKSRQTLLFSATQTQSVASLARLSLKDPLCISASPETTPVTHADGGETVLMTPKNLQQHYSVTPLDCKLDTLWSFIKTHLQTKTLVFLSSCKQVRFVFETFRRMHPGVPLLHLHGKQKQNARLQVYSKFTQTKHAVLFATDIAARGLDFPGVDWVVQADAPEDAETYVHRVGRTARYESNGRALLFLCPSEEEGMIKALEKKGVEVGKIKIRESKIGGIGNVLQKLAFEDVEVKYLGQRAFVSYLRSIHLQKDKSIFKVHELPVAKFAESLGLPGVPKIKFLNKEMAKAKKNASRTVASLKDDGTKHDKASKHDESSDESEEEHESTEEEETTLAQEAEEPNDASKSKKEGVRTKYDRMFERKNQNILSSHYTKLVDHTQDGAIDDEQEDFITLKRADHDLPDDAVLPEHEVKSKRKQKMEKSKKAMLKYKGAPSKLVFDDEGGAHEIYEMQDVDDVFKGGANEVMEEGRKFVEGERGRMQQADVIDKAEAKEKKREKKRRRKEREAGIEGETDDAEGPSMEPTLAPTDDDGYVSPDFDFPSESSEDEGAPPAKRRKGSGVSRSGQTPESGNQPTSLDEEEELAVKMLRTRR